MTNARRAGTSWTALIDRYCRRSKALLIALPLLLLSVFVDHGLAAAPDHGDRVDSSGHASDFDGSAGAEGKAQAPARPVTAIGDFQRPKPKPSSAGPTPQHGLAPPVTLSVHAISPHAVGRAPWTNAMRAPRGDARPRAPPAAEV